MDKYDHASISQLKDLDLTQPTDAVRYTSNIMAYITHLRELDLADGNIELELSTSKSLQELFNASEAAFAIAHQCVPEFRSPSIYKAQYTVRENKAFAGLLQVAEKLSQTYVEVPVDDQVPQWQVALQRKKFMKGLEYLLFLDRTYNQQQDRSESERQDLKQLVTLVAKFLEPDSRKK